MSAKRDMRNRCLLYLTASSIYILILCLIFLAAHSKYSAGRRGTIRMHHAQNRLAELVRLGLN